MGGSGLLWRMHGMVLYYDDLRNSGCRFVVILRIGSRALLKIGVFEEYLAVMVISFLKESRTGDFGEESQFMRISSHCLR